MLCSLGLGVVKVLASLFAGVGTGLLIVGYFAVQNPESWDPHLVNHYGPPLGPLMTAIGSGFLTTAGLMGVLFYRSGAPRVAAK